MTLDRGLLILLAGIASIVVCVPPTTVLVDVELRQSLEVIVELGNTFL